MAAIRFVMGRMQAPEAPLAVAGLLLQGIVWPWVSFRERMSMYGRGPTHLRATMQKDS